MDDQTGPPEPTGPGDAFKRLAEALHAVANGWKPTREQAREGLRNARQAHAIISRRVNTFEADNAAAARRHPMIVNAQTTHEALSASWQEILDGKAQPGEMSPLMAYAIDRLTLVILTNELETMEAEEAKIGTDAADPQPPQDERGDQ